MSISEREMSTSAMGMSTSGREFPPTLGGKETSRGGKLKNKVVRDFSPIYDRGDTISIALRDKDKRQTTVKTQ